MNGDEAMKQHGNKKDAIKFFTDNKLVQTTLQGITLTADHKKQIRSFFECFPDGDRSGTWRRNISLWILHDLGDWIERRKKLSGITSSSKEWFNLIYGESGAQKYEEFVARRISTLPSNVQYWMNRGFELDEARRLVSSSQKTKANKKVFAREQSIRCVEFWTTRGYSPDEAIKAVSQAQTRDLAFFQSTYGEMEGAIRYQKSIDSRNHTWGSKDKSEHAKKTRPRTYNENGQEMQIIRRVINDNNLSSGNCMYGKPNEQFWQQIPGVGFRRYDLAVFDSPQHEKLLYIIEYHGPGHINFSDYRPELKDEPITIKGKKLAFLGTYGGVYTNDMEKKKHIRAKFPDCQYIVIWTADIKNGELTIEKLQNRN